MKNEFTLAFNEVIEEKQLPREIILKALESAMVSAYRKAVNASNAQEVQAKVDPETGKVAVFAEKEVVDSVHESATEVELEVAKKYDPDAKIGDMVLVESTPTDFGRVAAQTARQVIQQRIRDAERQSQLDFYQQQLGEIISGVVQAVNASGLTIGLEMRAEGALMRKDMIPGERFRIHDRVRALVAEVKDNPKGPQIILSRTHRDFLRRLLENEVPEIYHGVVEIRSIAREPGERAKVAVSATQTGIDPVGACVGVRGVRIQAIVRELHDEKIDVIEWNKDPTQFIAKAISPARVVGVYLNEKLKNNKTATVVVSEDQLSLAIGRDGQNARLAAKLTGWRIDIKSLVEAASDMYQKVLSDPALSDSKFIDKENLNQIEALLNKKSEGRPLSPEEYEQMSKFVDKVERKLVKADEIVIAPEQEEAIKILRKSIPAELFTQNILDSGLPEHVNYLIQEAGYNTTGDLVLQMKWNPDEILRLQGIGPRAMQEIEKFLSKVFAPAPEISTSTETIEEIPAAEIVEEKEFAQPSDDISVSETLPESTEVSEMPAEILEKAAVEELKLQPVEPEEMVVQPPAIESEVLAEPLEESSFDKLFAMKATEFEPVIEEETDDDSGNLSKSKKAKKKKHRNVEIEYDPDTDSTVVHRKRKKTGTGWDTWEE